MKTRETQGSFITIIWTLITKIKEVVAGSVLIHPRADVVADLFLLPVISRMTQRRLAEEARLSDIVFRYSSSHPCASSCASSFRYRGC